MGATNTRISSVFLVIFPIARVGFYIGMDAFKFIFVADDALVIIALPDRGGGGEPQAVDQPGGGGFERSDDGVRDRPRMRATNRGHD
jgi:hypothetical protein